MGTSSGLCGCSGLSAWLASLAAWPSSEALAPGSVQPRAPISSWYTSQYTVGQQPVCEPANSPYIAIHHHTNQSVTNIQITSCTIIQPHSASHPSMQPSTLLSRQPSAPATSVAPTPNCTTYGESQLNSAPLNPIP